MKEEGRNYAYEGIAVARLTGGHTWIILIALLIWLVFFLILAANPGNKINQWCFATGFLCGIGTFKEFLYYELAGLIHSPAAHAIPDWLYSVMSGLFLFPAVRSDLCPVFFPRRCKKSLCFSKEAGSQFRPGSGDDSYLSMYADPVLPE